MGHKVFVSYKFSDSADTRDKIITALKGQGNYYKGEYGYVALELADSSLKKYLSDKLFDSTVTVVVISPNINQSKWVPWEIQYSLERQTRSGRTSKRNGIVCVIQATTDYSSPKATIGWQDQYNKNSNWAYRQFEKGKDLRPECIPPIIKRNMKDSFKEANYRGFLLEDESNTDRRDYCVVVAESTFLKAPIKYIDEAYARANDYAYETETR